MYCTDNTRITCCLHHLLHVLFTQKCVKQGCNHFICLCAVYSQTRNRMIFFFFVLFSNLIPHLKKRIIKRLNLIFNKKMLQHFLKISRDVLLFLLFCYETLKNKTILMVTVWHFEIQSYDMSVCNILSQV